jgi:uncharacterized protein (DUF305 family)
MKKEHSGMQHGQQDMGKAPYVSLLLTTVLSFIAMYFLMYAMVDVAGNVFMNVNNFYMAGVMAAPMVPLMLLFMRSMYRHKQLNLVFLVGSILVFLLLFFAIRQQAAVGDRQFLRSMIPHHAGALLMCRQASISDPEIKSLCSSIIQGQQSEIDQMKQMLQRLNQ